jgi:hypothetical protein
VKAAHDAAAAARVRKLEKPTISAWAVNQLYWRDRETFDALVQAGDRLRAAQRKLLMGGANTQLAELTQAREAAIAAAIGRAADFLREGGSDANQATRQRIGMTLDVIATEGGKASTPWGRWTEDLAPTGFGALAGLVPESSTPLRLVKTPADDAKPARASPTRDARPEKPSAASLASERTAKVNRARAELAQAESELRVRRGEAERAAAGERDAADRQAAARADLDDARRRLVEATRRAEAAEAAREEARSRSRAAAAAIKDAERAVAAARRGVEKAAT